MRAADRVSPSSEPPLGDEHQSVVLGRYTSLLDKKAWFGQALCTGTDPETFFPDRGKSTQEATAVCLSCPVRRECLEFAVANNETHGIWGGLSVRERRPLRRRVARARA